MRITTVGYIAFGGAFSEQLNLSGKDVAYAVH